LKDSDGAKLVQFITKVTPRNQLVVQIPKNLEAIAASVNSWVATVNAISGDGKITQATAAAGPEVVADNPNIPAKATATRRNVELVTSVLTAVDRGSQFNISKVVNFQSKIEDINFSMPDLLNKDVLEIVALCSDIDPSKAKALIVREDPYATFPTNTFMVLDDKTYLVPLYKRFLAALSESPNLTILFNLYKMGIVTKTQVSRWEKAGYAFCYSAYPEALVTAWGADQVLRDILDNLFLNNASLGLTMVGSGASGFDYRSYLNRKDVTNTLTEEQIGMLK